MSEQGPREYPSLQELKSRLGGKAYAGYSLLFCPAHDNRKSPALSVTETHGKYGPTLLLSCKAGCEQSEVIEALQDIGLWPKLERLSIDEHRAKELRKEQRKKRIEWDARRKEQIAQYGDGPKSTKLIEPILCSSTAKADQLVLDYLAWRGIFPPEKPTYLCGTFHHPTQYYNAGRKRIPYPAMIAQVVDANCVLQGVHCTFLDISSPWQKAHPVGENWAPRKIYGKKKGGCVWLCPGPAIMSRKVLWVCEGVETGAALQLWLDRQVLAGKIRIQEWPMVGAALTAENLVNFPIPPQVERVVIAGDLDAKDPNNPRKGEAGQRYATKAHLKYQLDRPGLDVAIKLPTGPIPEGKKSIDWLDVLVERSMI